MRPKKHSLHHASGAHRLANLRLERWHRRSVYLACTWLLLTGVLWLVAHFLLRVSGQFGEVVHPLEPWAMKLHGAGAMLALFFVGSLMNSHIRRALKSDRNRGSGWSMIVVLLALTISGYVLYYFASEQTRPLWSGVHWVIGLAFPVVIVVHIVLGRKSAAPATP